ncbi:hypothetical protein R5H30_21520 [Sulfitobacter sp. D35]|uniref:hypothetical protein n=1 Tax=Sulfitobacter sp. D35 TaxID=3083252 RepID=UPI00296F6331|nr:hypothetical protein [Sulfitobacter sp. D35]MDW4500577.1 hypothetical protein [Sulfitobacter sp. D35]
MKKKEWERRIKLDLEGIQLLGAALTLQAKERMENSQKDLEHRILALPHKDDLDFYYDISYYRRQLDYTSKNLLHVSMRTDALDTPKKAFRKARKLLVKDFQFRWHHLRDHMILVGYITDDVPGFAANWDRSTPICKQWGDDPIISALQEVFFSEYSRLTGQDPDECYELRTDQDFLFYLTVWKLCEPEKGRGHPPGRRWQDGVENAATYAYTIRSEAKKDGFPIPTDEAIRRALTKYKLVSPREFENFPDKEETIVTAAGAKHDRLQGAMKAVRKKLAEWD